MPSSNTVTTAQIVRTMKRGENGSINVSMGPLAADSAVLFLVGRKPKSATSLIQNPDNLYTISGAPVTDMTAAATSIFAVQRSLPDAVLKARGLQGVSGHAGAS